MSYQPGYSRGGLNARTANQEQAQVTIDMGPAFDIDREVEGLTSSVARLKQMSRAITEESQLSRQAAESLEEVLERSRMALKQGMRKLNRAFHQSKSNHLLYLALFVVAIFFTLYFWSKVYRFIRWFV
ncbi:hypothetical protein WJX73_006237 [Symbiochloris irregularis]|uniref:t-SNARE coiled-coil homology domain-containing protein n=1 Tax=Symbiochloris irregularis TaxID=706552 RepID=A0AAW1PDJ9_9CHLO